MTNTSGIDPNATTEIQFLEGHTGVFLRDLSQVTDPLHKLMLNLEQDIHPKGWDQEPALWLLVGPDDTDLKPLTLHVPAELWATVDGQPAQALEMLGTMMLQYVMQQRKLPPAPIWPTTPLGLPVQFRGVMVACEAWMHTIANDGDKEMFSGLDKLPRGKWIEDRPDRIEVRQLSAATISGRIVDVNRQRHNDSRMVSEPTGDTLVQIFKYGRVPSSMARFCGYVKMAYEQLGLM